MSYFIVNSDQTYDEMEEYLVSHDKEWFMDTETTGLDPYTCHLLLLQIRAGNITFVVDCLCPEFLLFRQKLQHVLSFPGVVKVFHNATFDMKIIYHHLGVMLENVVCIMINDQLINSGLYFDFNLAVISERRFGTKIDKSVRSGFIDRDITVPFTKEELEYAAKDVDVLEKIYREQVKEIEEKELQRVYELERRCLPVTVMMEYQGICIEKHRLEESIPITQAIVDKLNKSLQDDFIRHGVAEEIVFDENGYNAVLTSSPPQKLAAFNALGINVKSLGNKELSDWDAVWAKKNKKKTDYVDDLEDDVHIGMTHPILRKNAVITAVNKHKGTYLEGLLNKINPVTKRIHPYYKQCGAASTGRYSSSGPNFQNLTNSRKLVALGLGSCDIRSMFIPAPGCDFIISDFEGVELAILAILSQDAQLIKELTKGDIHSYVGNSLEPEKILDALGSLITKDNKGVGDFKTTRDEFKRVSYAIAYGTTGYNLYRTLYYSLASVGIIITQKDADRWVEQWKHELFPNTGLLLDSNADYAITRGYTESALGRKRFWTNDIRSNKWRMLAAMREGMNAPIQSTSADITKLAECLLYESLDLSQARIVATIHDELLVESKFDYTEEAMKLTKFAMEEAGRIIFPGTHLDLIKASPKKSDRYNK